MAILFVTSIEVDYTVLRVANDEDKSVAKNNYKM